METIPQTNPKYEYLTYKKEILHAIQSVLDSGWYILGNSVKEFESQFAEYIGVEKAVGVSSGTDAIELALRALDVWPNDVVLTVSHTAVATVSAIIRCEAMPFFIDIDPASYTMDPNSLKNALEILFSKSSPIDSSKVRAIIPVHLYGHPAEMESIRSLAKQYELNVIEDCAQSHGSTIAGEFTGSWSDIAAFSFYPTKNLGAIGDGGIVTTRDDQIYQKLMSLRQYGWRERYISEIDGVNSRLDEIQAAILSVKLKYLDSLNQRRIYIAEQYDKHLDRDKFLLPFKSENVVHVYHQYVIRCKERDRLMQYLRDQGIQTAIHYPLPVHQQPAFHNRFPQVVPLDHTEIVCKEILSLPMFPGLTEDNINYIIERMNIWSS